MAGTTRHPFDNDEFLVEFFEAVPVRTIVAMYASCRLLRDRVVAYAEQLRRRTRKTQRALLPSQRCAPCYVVLQCRRAQDSARRNRTLAAGPTHSLAASSDGLVAAFGHGAYGKLGTRSLRSSATPKLVMFPGRGVRVVQVAAAARHSLALDARGRCFAWGDNLRFQLGLGEDAPACVAAPRFVERAGADVVEIACGDEHSLFLSGDGLVRACGARDFAGIPTLQDDDDDDDFLCDDFGIVSGDGSLTPPRRRRSSHHRQQRAGEDHAFSSSDTHSGRETRRGLEEQRRPNRRRSCVALPTTLPRLADHGVVVVQVAAHGLHSLALDAGGNVYGWGRGAGVDGDDAARLEPTRVKGRLSGAKVSRVDCGADCSCAYAAATGAASPPLLFWWGGGVAPFADDDRFPARFVLDDALALVSLGGGGAGALVVDDHGDAFQLAKDGPALRVKPLHLPRPCVAVACADDHFLCCLDDASVLAAGSHRRRGLVPAPLPALPWP